MHPRTRGLALAGLMIIACALPAQAGATTGSTDSPTTSTSARTALTSTEFETRLLSLVNARRTRIGCRAVRTNTALVRSARAHTRRMVAAGNLSHRVAGEPSLGRRIVNAGYLNWTAAGENIAWGAGTPQYVYNLWINSSGHRANIQNCGFRDGGVGVVFANGRPWVTLDLGRHR
ncbi:MAG: CAP domain-containing protein [Propionibacteriales bacterium]|nr:CAP domain-containing protein [Propionibacteriales bacterium]